MSLQIQELLALKQLLGTTSELPSDREPSPAAPQKDPLIAQTWDYALYLGIFTLAIALVAIIGFVSPRAEHALYFAIALSIIIIAFLLTI